MLILRRTYGSGKLVKAQEYIDKTGTNWEECTFYTDSYTDISVLEVVGHPVAVHPDPRLLRRARKSGWPVADWGNS